MTSREPSTSPEDDLPEEEASQGDAAQGSAPRDDLSRDDLSQGDAAQGAVAAQEAEAPPPLAAVTPPLVRLERVVASDDAGPHGDARGRLHHAEAAFAPGVHMILGTPEDGTLALAHVLSGRTRPSSGRVRVGGHDPARHAKTRARLGALLGAPELPDTRTVAAVVEMAQRARGEARPSAAALLDGRGLGRLLARRPVSLSFAEARAVELALALSTPEPLCVVLVEPFAEVTSLDAAALRVELHALAEKGACVLVLTSSRTDAWALGDHVHQLDRGVLLPALPAGRGGEIVVQVEEPRPGEEAAGGGVRALATALTEVPGLQAVAWEEAQRAPQVPSGGDTPHPTPPAPTLALSTLRVRAADLDAASLSILDAATRAGVVLASIRTATPPPTRRQVGRTVQPGGGR
ncbi:hypothetical protein [Chondromyces apiculatus]|uniref:Putative ABC transporter, ATP-binding protein n=1 Tax=Chondromyces apiculatus DSM 436 TaxID=1192034 RepID=A0A017T2M2_9BACT|nr:hypothetical protein [Chondromyces apiculatus]EYF03483.1 putative ABC transporter, ATP-binding protein [Chondromyces apiculatus DSM 436]